MLIVLLVALAVIAFFLLRSVLGGNVTVPNVVGDTSSVAAQTLQNDNLTVGTTTFHTSSQPRGIVLSTNPASGASVSKNSTVNLVVSGGPNVPIVTVPSVKGKQLATAIQLIQAAGLTYKVRNVGSTQPVGTVLDQNPAGGAKVKATVPVQLTVSGTQTSVSVPSVLGQSPASAGSALTQAGLNVGSQTNACSNQFPQQGLVSSQSPAGGADRPAEHADQPRRLERPLHLGPQRGRPVGQRCAVGHHRRRARRQPDHRHDVPQRGHAGQRRHPDTGCRHPGGQRHHGQHLGLPVDVDHDDHDHDSVVDHDHVDHGAPARRAPPPRRLSDSGRRRSVGAAPS